MKQVILIILTFTICFRANTQTSNKYELLDISTGNPSITMEAKKNGSSLEVWIYNKHDVTYDVRFKVNVVFRGVTGEFTKTVNMSGRLNPNGSNYSNTTYIGFANDGFYYSLERTELLEFNYKVIENFSAKNALLVELNNLVSQKSYNEALELLDSKGQTLTHDEVTKYRERINDGLRTTQQTTTSSNESNNNGNVSTKSDSTQAKGSNLPQETTSENYKDSQTRIKEQEEKRKNKLINQAATVAVDAIDFIADGISNALERKSKKRSVGYSAYDPQAAIGYFGGVNSWLGMEVDLITPGFARLGWGITMRVNPLFLSDIDTSATGTYVGTTLGDQLVYNLLNKERKMSFSIGGHLNFGLTTWMILQAGIGFGGIYWYKVYRITDTAYSGNTFDDYIGKKVNYRKPADKILGMTTDFGLVFKISNVVCFKGGVSFYGFRFQKPEITFGILFMPNS